MAKESSVNLRGENSQSSPSLVLDTKINMNMRLCSVLLNEFNYLPWSRVVPLAFGGRGKLGFINGGVEAPESSTQAYEAWLCKDQQVMSMFLNSMEKHIAEIFSYSESLHDLWKSMKDMYGNQNNYARVFQLKRDIASLQQDGKTFVQHLGSLKTMWNELDVYLPHTIDVAVLLKRVEEDKIYQLSVNLNSDYKDLRSHILMIVEFPSFKTVCATVQREEARRRVMNLEKNSIIYESRIYVAKHKPSDSRPYKDKNPHLKCSYYHIMIPSRQFHTGSYKPQHAANHNYTLFRESIQDFTSNPVSLINDFAIYMQTKGHREAAESSRMHLDLEATSNHEQVEIVSKTTHVDSSSVLEDNQFDHDQDRDVASRKLKYYMLAQKIFYSYEQTEDGDYDGDDDDSDSSLVLEDDQFDHDQDQDCS
ncbi:hypothetical protein D8674_006271 [Pyrus ussuriensis x Pyrus communis]|uniref:Retrotransposon Copia-like N-terminal domain-containing protein n=1 Tax=Pyrus ussuriensis x Pyrus communis TaxID=2448454 RepID=A0A5N5G7I6_9ROSA|nr:hypothetical protein D8674_006271 [Pyrus ussuriensis x Pyrus communis]